MGITIHGVKHTTEGDIATIRNILRGYPKGFSVVKELIQNAEDAHAESIKIGWHQGFLKANNPLLKCPSLFMINDGRFDDIDREAIGQIGLGTKSSNEHAIGRFGLGLKSIFNHCEAFFYMASNPQNSKEPAFIDLFNPWQGFKHNEWNNVEDDIGQLILGTVKHLLPKKQWFLLWSPLRTRELCSGVPAIIDNYSGEDTEFKEIFENFQYETAEILSLLRNLKQVSFYYHDMENPFISVSVNETSSRSSFPEKNDNKQINGSLLIKKQQDSLEIDYSGIEGWLNNYSLKKLKESDDWPKVVSITKEGLEIDKKDKGAQHYSTLFIKNKGSRKLKIKWAVFLPVGNIYEEIPLKNFQEDITLILHGYFFLSSDRTNIDGLQEDFNLDESIYLKWNKTLATEGTLNNILPALEYFVKQSEINNEMIKEITIALKNSKLFINFGKYIFKNYKWAFLLKNREDLGEWSLIDADTTIYELPQDEDKRMPFKVFPNLSEILKDFKITLDDYPIIGNKETSFSPELLKVLLNQVVNLKQTNEITYLKNFINEQIQRNPNNEFLVDLIKDKTLFKSYNFKKQENFYISLEKIKILIESKSLFKDSQNNRILSSLQNVCKENEIVSIDNEDAYLLQNLKIQIPEISKKDISDSILISSLLDDLDDINSRIEIIKYIYGSADQIKIRKALRYLLHRKRNFKDDISTSLYITAGNETWDKVLKIILNQKDDDWRIIDSNFAPHLNDALLNEINIKKTDRDNLASFLKDENIQQIDFTDLTEKDYREILLNLGDDEIIRKIPIHQTVNGNRVSINDNTFLECDFSLQGELRQQWVDLVNNAIVIKSFNDTIVRARQRDFIPELDADAAIKLSLCMPSPSNYAAVIMKAFAQKGNPKKEIRELTKKTKWLPSQNEKSIAPKDVLHIEGANDEIDRLLNGAEHGYYSILSIEKWVIQHRGFNTLKTQLFPNFNETIQVLAEVIQERQDFKIGIDSLYDIESLKSFILVFSDAPVDLLPCIGLLKELLSDANNDKFKVILDDLMPSLFGHTDVKRYRKILNFLSDTKFNIDFKKDVHQMYLKYLKATIESGNFETILPYIKFLNRNGSWRLSRELIPPSENIADRYIIDSEQWKVIKEVIEEREKRKYTKYQESTQIDNKSTTTLLKQYFDPWLNIVSNEIIGALMSLLGDSNEIKAWAIELLGNHTLEITREKMFRHTNEAPEGYLKQISKMKFIIEKKIGSNHTLTSIAGDELNIELKDSIDSLIFGNPNEMWCSVGNDMYLRKITLLELQRNQLEEFGINRLEELLKKTAELIAFYVYLNCIDRLYPNFTELWNELRQKAQRDISYAQNMLINEGSFYIRQLGGHRFPHLKENLDKWKEVNNLDTDIQNETDDENKKRLKTKLEELRRKAREDLKKILSEDEKIHVFLVNAVCEQLHKYQYEISSIPFEIFQNADDAYQEADIIGLQLVDKPIFIMRLSNNVLNLIHWGRPINKYYGNMPPDRGIKLGYDRDIEKMLTLSFSDKNTDTIESQQVTGKFGLGFKSVYFAATYPLILSERIHFKIRAGFYPMMLLEDEINRLQGIIKQYNDINYKRGTIIHLPLRQDVNTSYITDRFKNLVGFLLAFAKKIKTCVLDINEEHKKFIWKEEPIGENNLWYLGTIGKSEYYLVCKVNYDNTSHTQCTFLFKLSSRGIESISSDIPSLWITAPTAENCDLGFVLNGPFDPDVGRLQLAHNSDKNKRIQDKMTHAMGKAFEILYETISKEWEQIRRLLQFSPDMNIEDFWHSLWKLVTSDKVFSAYKEQGGARKMLSSILLNGFRTLVSSYPVIPSELPSVYKMYISINQLEYYTDGLLQERYFFENLCKLDKFKTTYETARMVSSGVYQKLKSFNRFNDDDLKIDLLTFLKKLFVKDRVNPEDANKMGLILNKKIFERYENTYPEEIKEIKLYLNELSFKTIRGTYGKCKNLIIGVNSKLVDKDEFLRSSFAPDDCILSNDYLEEGISFFILCRHEMNAPAKTLDMWAKSYTNEDRLNGVLEYLIKGSLRHELASEIGIQWFHGIKETNSYKCLTDEEQEELRWLFRDGYSLLPTPSPTMQKYNSDTLFRIYEWWLDNKEKEIRAYEEDTFPNGEALYFTQDDIDKLDNDITKRKKWLKLFMLGSFHTMGRQMPHQHRYFIELCDKQGWLDRLATPKVPPKELISILDEYLQMQNYRSIYYHWMKHFISFYQFSTWLNEYVYSLSEINKMDKQFEIDMAFNIRTNPNMTGSGLDAPLLDKAIGVGMCFIVRELIRGDFIVNTYAYEHAFVPHKRVRDILNRLGMENTEDYVSTSHSRNIKNFIQESLKEKSLEDRYHFERSFDIPFLRLSENPEKLKELANIDINSTEETSYSENN